MELQEAKDILNTGIRSECRDHAFGDAEVYWERGGVEIASGYFGGQSAYVSIKINDGTDTVSFDKEDARALRECGTLGGVDRNDETGPDTYTEGVMKPGLSVADVLEELTGKRN